MEGIKMAIVEDDEVVRQSLHAYFRANPQFEVVETAASVEAFLTALKADYRMLPDIVLLDIQLPGMSGIQGIPLIRDARPDADIIMLTTFEDSEKIFAALCAGACSYLSKQSSLVNIREAVLTVSRGGSYMSPGIARKVVEHFAPKPKDRDPLLTERQQEIVQCIVDGLSYKMIADRLQISHDTVRTHIMHIYRALNINSKGELIRKMLDKK